MANRSVLAYASGSTLSVWDLEQGQQFADLGAFHYYGVNALAVGELAGRPVVVFDGRDRTVQAWGLKSPIWEKIEVGSAVTSVALQPSASLLLIGAGMGLMAIQL